MLETPRTPEIDYNSPVSVADMPMLATFGVTLPEDDNEAWLEDFDRKVAVGSRDLLGCDPEAARGITTSRLAVINEFTALKPATRIHLSTATSGKMPTPAQSNSIIAAMRALYHNRHGVDAVKVANYNVRVLLLDPKWIDTRLDNFDSLGLVPKKVAVAALTYPTITITDKLDDLTDLGLPATHVINGWPELIQIDKKRIQERLDNLTDLGLDALRIATAEPRILKYLPRSFRTKFLLLETAFRYFGAADPRARAIAFAEEAPSQFSNSPHRVRTLIRIGSSVLPPAAVAGIGRKSTLPLMIQDLDVTLGAYLSYQYAPEKEHSELATVREFCTFCRHQKDALGKAALKELITEHADDPVIQFHNKRKSAAAA